jgi:hypothetical protein
VHFGEDDDKCDALLLLANSNLKQFFKVGGGGGAFEMMDSVSDLDEGIPLAVTQN